MGVVQDRSSGQVFHRRVEDAFLFEIANSPNDSLLKRLRVCQLMPTHVVLVTRDTLSLDKPYVSWNDRVIQMRPNEPLQFVCKVLHTTNKCLDISRIHSSICKRLTPRNSKTSNLLILTLSLPWFLI